VVEVYQRFGSSCYGHHQGVLAATLIALMMQAARTSETLINFYRTTQRYNTEDSHLQMWRYFLS
jgi:hypothetical protein